MKRLDAIINALAAAIENADYCTLPELLRDLRGMREELVFNHAITSGVVEIVGQHCNVEDVRDLVQRLHSLLTILSKREGVTA